MITKDAASYRALHLSRKRIIRRSFRADALADDLGMPRRWRSSSSTSSASKEVPDQYDLSRRTLT